MNNTCSCVNANELILAVKWYTVDMLYLSNWQYHTHKYEVVVYCMHRVFFYLKIVVVGIHIYFQCNVLNRYLSKVFRCMRRKDVILFGMERKTKRKTTYDNGIGLMVWAEQLKQFTTECKRFFFLFIRFVEHHSIAIIFGIEHMHTHTQIIFTCIWARTEKCAREHYSQWMGNYMRSPHLCN